MAIFALVLSEGSWCGETLSGPMVVPSIEETIAATPGGYFPVLVKLGPQRLGAVIRRGAPHVGIGGRLSWIASEDGGKTWSEPTVVVDSEWDDRNPACGVMPDGSIVVAYQECHNYDEEGNYGNGSTPSTYWYVRSDDGGRTWSDRRPLRTKYGCPFGQMVTLEDGSVVMSCYGWHHMAGLVRSDDNGRTWRDYSRLPGFGETAICRDEGGTLYAFMRTDEARWALGAQAEASDRVGHYLRVSRSDDAGRTWSEPVTVTGPNEHPGGASVLQSGDLLLTYGQRHAPYGVGARIWSKGAEVTPDGGHGPVLLAHECLTSDCGYPSPVQLSDGTIVVLFYATGTFSAGYAEQAICLRLAERDLNAAVRHPQRMLMRDDFTVCRPAESLEEWTWREGLGWARGGTMLHIRDPEGDEVLEFDPRLSGRFGIYVGTRAVTPGMKLRVRLAGEEDWHTIALPDTEGKDHPQEVWWKEADMEGRVIEIGPVAGSPAYLDYFRFVPGDGE